jgi:hypothetical protein
MWESLLLLLKRAPFTALMLPVWLRRGRAYLKRQIATHAVPDPGTLPCREEVLAFLGQSRSEGRNLVLALPLTKFTPGRSPRTSGFSPTSLQATAGAISRAPTRPLA